MAKKVIVIGGGLAGLSAGCYAAMNGFETQIFEHHAVPGGVAATWKRGRLFYRTAVFTLFRAIKPGNGMHKILSELGAADAALFTDMNDYGKFIHEASGISLEISGDIDKTLCQFKRDGSCRQRENR